MKRKVGGRRKGAGRPPQADSLTASAMVRMTPSGKAARQAVAARQGLPLSDWMRQVSETPEVLAIIESATDDNTK